MRLFTSEKEAHTLQEVLAAYIVTHSGENADTAQALLARIATCLELQGKEKAAAQKGSD